MTTGLGGLLRGCREQARFGQKELAWKIGISPSMISRFESGQRRPDPELFERILNAFEIHGVAQNSLGQLRHEYYPTRGLMLEPVDEVVRSINEVLQALPTEYRNLLSNDLRAIMKVDQGYVRALQTLDGLQWTRARELLQSLKDQFITDTQSILSRIEEQRAWALYGEGRYTEAVESYELALQTAPTPQHSSGMAALPGNWDRRAELRLRVGDIYRRQATWKAADREYEMAQSLFENLQDPLQVARCLTKRAGVLLSQAKTDRASDLLADSLKIYEEHQESRGVYKVLQHKAWGLALTGRWIESVALHREALAIIGSISMNEAESLVQRAKASRYLADVCRLVPELRNEAEELYLNALRLLEHFRAKGTELKLLPGMVELGLGELYLELPGRETAAQEHLYASRDISVSLGERLSIPLVQNALGKLLSRQGRLDLAEIHLNLAHQRFRDLENSYYLGDVLVNLCKLHLENKAFETVYERAAEVETITPRPFHIHRARALLAAGSAMLRDESKREGRFSEAFDTLSRASESALSYNEFVFGEASGQIAGLVDQLVQAWRPDMAIALCKAYKAFWQARAVDPMKQRIVDQSLELLQSKQQEIQILLPAAQ